MYEEYWQLQTKPFEPPVTGDAEGGVSPFFASEAHQGALLKLRYAIQQRRAAAVIAGPGGIGKTLLVERLVQEFDESVTPIARVVFPQMSERDLLCYLADRFGAPLPVQPRWSTDESIRRLEEFFHANLQADRHAVLVIDEAHLLEDTGLLETLRLLLNLGTGTAPAFTVILIGQMGLLSALGRTPALEERVAVKTLLRPFSVEETAQYIQYRLTAAGGQREIFDQTAIETMHVLTGGIARRIDRLGDLALVIGFADGRPTIDGDHIASVSRELLTVTPE